MLHVRGLGWYNLTLLLSWPTIHTHNFFTDLAYNKINIIISNRFIFICIYAQLKITLYVFYIGLSF